MAARLSTPIVGRGDDLARLERVLLDADPVAAAHAALVAGDAGVGKTRLLDEVVATARDRGWRVLTGHCLDVGEAVVAYLPFSEMLGRLGTTEPEVAAALVGDRPALRRLLPSQRTLGEVEHDGAVGPAPVGTDTVERGDLVAAVLAALDHLAAAGPTLVVVEDAHWAEPSTRDVLTVLLARRPDAPLRIAVTYRSDDLHRRHPMRSTIAQWGRTPGVSRLAVEPLSDTDVRSLVAAHVPDRRLSDHALAAIVARAQGNAFYAEELAGVDPDHLPDDLADLLLVRLETLSDPARSVVRAAAAAGGRVAHATLAAVLDRLGGVASTDLDPAVREAVERHVLVAGDADDYVFRHALLAEAVHDDLLPGERARLHDAYVSALLAAAGSGPTGPPSGTAAGLARHAALAGRLEVALDASVRAGDEALRVGAGDEAAEHLVRALDLLDRGVPVADPPTVGGAAPTRDERATRLAVRAARAWFAAGHVHRATAFLRDRAAHLPDGSTAAERAELLATMGEMSMSIDDGVDGRGLLDEIDALLDDAAIPDPSRARVLAATVHVRSAYRLLDDATRAGVEALRLAERSGQMRLATSVRQSLGRVAQRAGDPDRARAVVLGTIDDAVGSADVESEVRGRFQLLVLDLDAGRMSEAARGAALVREVARAARREWSPYGYEARVQQVTVATVLGDWDLAVSASDTRGEAAPPLAAAMLTAAGLPVRVARGDDVGAALDDLRGWWSADGLIAVQCAYAALDPLAGRADPVDRTAAEGALGLHDEIVDLVAAAWGSRRFGARCRMTALLCGRLADASGRVDAGTRQRWLDATAEPMAVLRETASGDGALGQGPEGLAWIARAEAEHLRLRAGLGESVDAATLVEAWEHAVAAFDRFGHAYETARSRVGLAAALSGAGRVEAARAQIAEARATATTLGAGALLSRLPGEAPVPGAAPAAADAAALTPREHEILRHVAQGRTNGEIGTALFISTKTVSVHVSRILAKLGAARRTEAAAIARRRGLLD